MNSGNSELISISESSVLTEVDNDKSFIVTDAMQKSLAVLRIDVLTGIATKWSTIKTAYRNKARTIHPDHNRSPDAKEKFIELSDAFLSIQEAVTKDMLGDLKDDPETAEFLRQVAEYSRDVSKYTRAVSSLSYAVDSLYYEFENRKIDQNMTARSIAKTSHKIQELQELQKKFNRNMEDMSFAVDDISHEVNAFDRAMDSQKACDSLALIAIAEDTSQHEVVEMPLPSSLARSVFQDKSQSDSISNKRDNFQLEDRNLPRVGGLFLQPTDDFLYYAKKLDENASCASFEKLTERFKDCSDANFRERYQNPCSLNWENSCTPLMLAAGHGYIQLVKFLVQKKNADLELKTEYKIWPNETALGIAIKKLKEITVRTSLSTSGIENEYPLKADLLDVIRFLISVGSQLSEAHRKTLTEVSAMPTTILLNARFENPGFIVCCHQHHALSRATEAFSNFKINPAILDEKEKYPMIAQDLQNIEHNLDSEKHYFDEEYLNAIQAAVIERTSESIRNLKEYAKVRAEKGQSQAERKFIYAAIVLGAICVLSGSSVMGAFELAALEDVTLLLAGRVLTSIGSALLLAGVASKLYRWMRPADPLARSEFTLAQNIERSQKKPLTSAVLHSAFFQPALALDSVPSSSTIANSSAAACSSFSV